MLEESFSELELTRLEKLRAMEEKGMDPFPIRAEQTHTSKEAIESFSNAEAEGDDTPIKVTLAGRIRALRPMGKIAFAHIDDRDGRVQLFFRINDLGEEKMEMLSDYFDLGDFIQASGYMFRTRRGEVSLYVEDFKMLAKALRPLPAAKDEIVDGEVLRHAKLSDPETRYRQRYVDLAVNPDVQEIFKIRAATLRSLRDYLDNHDFIEVETPILQPIYGGAAAQPFTTHHNQLHQDLYLRISFELYLKRLLVGGLERVYEIGRDFRNEGVSYKHNPEFTQLEFYWAYSDYQEVMQFTEEMIGFAAKQVLGSTKITFDNQEIDLSPPWRRVELRQGILDATGIDIDEHPDSQSLEAAMKAKNLNPKPGSTRGKLIDSIIGDFLEPNAIQPTFIYNYPRDISPLAKSKPGDPGTVERFEGFVGGMELCNAFSELNDPLDQEQRFLEMGRAYADDDEEQHPMDDDYLNALSYGMPPAGGFGIGVDRLVMLFSGRRSIREVILFPHLRSLSQDE
ncbi:MAG: lysine--tRNA ligase [Brevefilum sp.]|nr:lysine--tRNA ligase [Brevefilum sp.]MDT8382119.1 lysine--tRNA ligase [Brevefilum sp.]MDW7755272.1 lysine--tRNA ligase [Brevefilum sp.]